MPAGLFQDLARYGLRPPRHVEQAIAETDYVTHQNWIFYQFSHAAAFHTRVPNARRPRLAVREVPEHVRQVLPAALGVGAT